MLHQRRNLNKIGCLNLNPESISIDYSENEEDILNLLGGKDTYRQISPKEADKKLNIGMERTISIFLELEFKGLLEWVSLNLLEIELEQSTKAIYETIYKSKARLTKTAKKTSFD